MSDNIKRRMKIFIVDDDNDDRELLVEILHEVGDDLDVQEFKNGQELIDALNECKDQCPDLVFLDLNMPILDGTSALKIIRETQGFKDIPIIAIYSTSSAQHDQEQTFNLGADIYVSKPTDFNILKDTLIEILNIDWKTRTKSPANYILKLK